jgi:hypothetical protein
MVRQRNRLKTPGMEYEQAATSIPAAWYWLAASRLTCNINKCFMGFNSAFKGSIAAGLCMEQSRGSYGKGKVKVTLVLALRLCTGHTAHSGSKGIALLLHDHGTRRGEWSASRPGRSLPRKRPGTHFTGGWVDPRAGLNRCGKSRLHRDSIPGPSSA